MINFLYPFFGIRLGSTNMLGEEVEVCEWSHPVYNPSGHLGIKFQKNGVDYYFSFSPENADGISDIPFTELRKGRPGHIIRKYEDETLLWGFRNAWGKESILMLSDNQIAKLYEFYIASKRPGQSAKMPTQDQIAFLRTQLSANEDSLVIKSTDEQFIETMDLNSEKDFEYHLHNVASEMSRHFKSLSDSQLHTIANMHPDHLKAKLRTYGQPQVTTLRTCDLDQMIGKISEYSRSTPGWAPWAGTYYHQPNTHNCSSIILDILYAGKMDRLTTSHATRMSYAGLLLGLLSLVETDDPLWVCVSMGVGFFAGRAVGGAYDGYSNAQHFFNMNAGTKHDKTSTVLGMRLLSTCLGAVIGLMKWGPFFPAYLTLPKNVVALVKEAKDLEDAIYVPSKIRQNGTGAFSIKA